MTEDVAKSGTLRSSHREFYYDLSVLQHSLCSTVQNYDVFVTDTDAHQFGKATISPALSYTSSADSTEFWTPPQTPSSYGPWTVTPIAKPRYPDNLSVPSYTALVGANPTTIASADYQNSSHRRGNSNASLRSVTPIPGTMVSRGASPESRSSSQFSPRPPPSGFSAPEVPPPTVPLPRPPTSTTTSPRFQSSNITSPGVPPLIGPSSEVPQPTDPLLKKPSSQQVLTSRTTSSKPTSSNPAISSRRGVSSPEKLKAAARDQDPQQGASSSRTTKERDQGSETPKLGQKLKSFFKDTFRRPNINKEDLDFIEVTHWADDDAEEGRS
nr:hypothetical protein CFP56_36237 [Quercus suber]